VEVWHSYNKNNFACFLRHGVDGLSRLCHAAVLRTGLCTTHSLTHWFKQQRWTVPVYQSYWQTLTIKHCSWYRLITFAMLFIMLEAVALAMVSESSLEIRRVSVYTVYLSCCFLLNADY